VVEYALIIAAVVVMSLGAIQSLQGESNDEVQNEFDCISERPPPPSCQKRAVTTTTSTTISATTSTTQPAPTTSSTESTTTTSTTTTTTAAPFVTTANWSGGSRAQFPGGPRWSARTRLTLTDPSGELLVGAVVTIEVINPSSGAVLGSYECTTEAGTGRCIDSGGSSRPYITIPGNVNSVRFRVASVTYTPPAAAPTQLSPILTRP
jgi:hypothetical protein